MVGFSEVQHGKRPPSIQAAAASNYGSSAKMLEAAYIQSAARTRPRSAAPPMTPGSALRSAKTPSDWGAKRQTFSIDSVQQEVQQRLRGAGGPTPPQRGRRVGGAALAASSSDFGPQDGEPENPDVQLIGPVSATGDADDADDADGVAASPTRAPGLAGELARAQALLADATAEQSRLEAELAHERESAQEAAEQAQSELDAERERYRREVDFVRAGVDAAAAERERAAAKRKEAHEKALKRAVREAEERTNAAADQAAQEAAEAHQAILDDVQFQHEQQLADLRCAPGCTRLVGSWLIAATRSRRTSLRLGACGLRRRHGLHAVAASRCLPDGRRSRTTVLSAPADRRHRVLRTARCARRSQFVSLAFEVRRLQGDGVWPGGPDAGEVPQEGEEMDEVQAHQVLASAIASVEASGGGG
jgi:chemotaxis protein histidine kinase CheA